MLPDVPVVMPGLPMLLANFLVSLTAEVSRGAVVSAGDNGEHVSANV